MTEEDEEMPIYLNELPAEVRARIAGNRKVRNKYGAVKTEANGIRFDSKAEAARYDVLMAMLRAGKIRDLRLQPHFTLSEAWKTPNGEPIRSIVYIADFSYWKDGHLIVEDVKSKATRTPQYAMKRKMMAAAGWTITEVG